MGQSDQDLSRLEANRMAATIAAGSLLVLVAIAVAYRYGLFDELLPAAGFAAEDLPMLLLVPLLVLVLVIWSWSRILSFFE
ncbi:hypothetical protein OB955_18475 [Halobacteria archaeon AArc-m2/3/4]|uniref:Uncharacterized protein n=1 Tax=Natronoglomus mannanivorans TaxID=2979990 RepID=A0AAP2Z0E1_9EURY|nr:hypothetical protein [Halobacteria archaeon AArc-xg1-1]MCU4974708.1 hypothetical protein [Halobacteria archaeon AArc-m2/3/4]